MKEGVFCGMHKMQKRNDEGEFFTFGGITVESKTKSIFETPETSNVECYVCNKCGYIEFKATDYKKF